MTNSPSSPSNQCPTCHTSFIDHTLIEGPASLQICPNPECGAIFKLSFSYPPVLIPLLREDFDALSEDERTQLIMCVAVQTTINQQPSA
jgi:hypothetical protein